MAKKNHSKKHKFKYAEPTTAITSAASVQAPVSATTSNNVVNSRPGASMAPTRDFSYVGQDLRRIVMFGLVLIALELIIWAVFSKTGLDDTVYSWLSL